MEPVTKNIHSDLGYLINVLRSELIVDYITELKINDGKDPDFFKYKDLKYIRDFGEKEAKIKCIVKIQDIQENKAYDGKTQTLTMRSCTVIDTHGDNMKLLLWDHQPMRIDDLGIQNGDIIHLLGANTRKDKDSNILLNLGKFARMDKLSDICDPNRFGSSTSPVSVPSKSDVKKPSQIFHGQAKYTFPLLLSMKTSPSIH